MNINTQEDIKPEITTEATFASESEKLKELFNDPYIDVERFIEQQEWKLNHQNQSADLF